MHATNCQCHHTLLSISIVLQLLCEFRVYIKLKYNRAKTGPAKKSYNNPRLNLNFPARQQIALLFL